MKSVKAEIVCELVINKSTFINYLIPVSNLEDVHKNLNLLKEKYSDASHHCFAYILGHNQDLQKYSDDGEPSKTAGYPMMEVLKKHDLTNVLTVTIRYFGGIKLGAGGLVRAYTKSCATSMIEATFTKKVNYSQVIIEIPFKQIGNVEKYLRDNYKLLNTSYGEFVSYIVNIKTSELLHFKSVITNSTKGDSHCEILNTFDSYE
ncbi:MAG: YigZ family protein [Candidatus Izimaplasma sp.]|nr:YigZ family protein [Candidatus Izimaplasma bacterium]